MFEEEDTSMVAVCLLPPQSLPAVSVAELAERRLRSSPYLALRNVACDSQGGILVLRGCLPSYFLKQMAQAVVAQLEGVKQVINQIEVVTAPTVVAHRW